MSSFSDGVEEYLSRSIQRGAWEGFKRNDDDDSVETRKKEKSVFSSFSCRVIDVMVGSSVLSDTKRHVLDKLSTGRLCDTTGGVFNGVANEKMSDSVPNRGMCAMSGGYLDGGACEMSNLFCEGAGGVSKVSVSYTDGVFECSEFVWLRGDLVLLVASSKCGCVAFDASGEASSLCGVVEKSNCHSSGGQSAVVFKRAVWERSCVACRERGVCSVP
jgi:hypothetical protein